MVERHSSKDFVTLPRVSATRRLGLNRRQIDRDATDFDWKACEERACASEGTQGSCAITTRANSVQSVSKESNYRTAKTVRAGGIQWQ
jgi:hypothetical protein